jgi:methylenetetrahydrofolate reductase (NADPH)
MPKLIESINERIQDGEPFFSLEFFPPRTASGAVNLISRFDRFAKGEPLFIDITWGAGGGRPEDDTVATSSMNIASTALNYCALPTMLHLTCAGSTRKQLIDVLHRAKKLGIRNIMALRGGMLRERERARERECVCVC